MKKAVSVLAVLVLAAVAIAGCTPATPVTPDPPEASGIAKLGLGLITSIASSTDLKVDDDGDTVAPVGQVETVIAAVAFDEDGKIVKVVIDTAQTKVNFDEDLQVTSDLEAGYPTKVELGDAYGMGRVSTIEKEWFEQAEELEKWMVGKTAAEVKSMKVTKRDDNHPAIPDVPELTSLVTMTVQDYLAAVEKAYNNAVEVPPGAEKLGLGHEISIGSSKGYSADEDVEVLPLAQVDNVVAATLFDKDGKVVRAIIDTAQTKVQYDNEGKITSDKSAVPKSKVELKEAYGMAKVSPIKKEWYEQAAELEKWMAGKTVSEIKALKLTGKGAPDDPELTSLVTMTVSDYLKAVAESHTNAK